MRRRAFLSILVSAASWPFAAHAQQPMPVVGFLRSTSLAPFENLIDAFRKGLNEAGFVEGVAIEYRWAEANTTVYLR
jgi:putative ABC transport system substrate-binding protein